MRGSRDGIMMMMNEDEQMNGNATFRLSTVTPLLLVQLLGDLAGRNTDGSTEKWGDGIHGTSDANRDATDIAFGLWGRWAKIDKASSLTERNRNDVLHHDKVRFEWASQFIVESLQVGSDGIAQTEEDTRRHRLSFSAEEEEGAIVALSTNVLLGIAAQLHQHALVGSSQYSRITACHTLLGNLVPKTHDLLALSLSEFTLALNDLSTSPLEIGFLITVLDGLEILGECLSLVGPEVDDMRWWERSRLPATRSNGAFAISMLIRRVEEDSATLLLGACVVPFSNGAENSGGACDRTTSGSSVKGSLTERPVESEESKTNAKRLEIRFSTQCAAEDLSTQSLDGSSQIIVANLGHHHKCLGRLEFLCKFEFGLELFGRGDGGEWDDWSTVGSVFRLLLGNLLLLLFAQFGGSWCGWFDDFWDFGHESRTVANGHLLQVKIAPRPVIFVRVVDGHGVEDLGLVWNSRRLVDAENDAVHAGEVCIGIGVHEGHGRFSTGSIGNVLAVLVDQLGKCVALDLGKIVQIDLLDGECGRRGLLEKVGCPKVDSEQDKSATTQDGVAHEGGVRHEGLERVVEKKMKSEAEDDDEHKDGEGGEDGVKEDEAGEHLVDPVAFFDGAADSKAEDGGGEEKGTNMLVKCECRGSSGGGSKNASNIGLPVDGDEDSSNGALKEGCEDHTGTSSTVDRPPYEARHGRTEEEVRNECQAVDEDERSTWSVLDVEVRVKLATAIDGLECQHHERDDDWDKSQEAGHLSKCCTTLTRQYETFWGRSRVCAENVKRDGDKC